MSEAFQPSTDGHPSHERSTDHLDDLTIREKIAALIVIILPFAALAVGIYLAWGRGFTWVDAGLLVGGYVLTALGVTVGYHRYFTHSSFKTNAVVKAGLAILGSTAVEGPPTKWAAIHRCHHQHSDDDHDPHSPHHHGGGVLGIIRGFFHAHMGWILRGDPKNLDRYNPDLRSDKVTMVMSKLWTVWALLGFVIPALLGGWLAGGLTTWSWTGFGLGFLWGGLVRLLVVHHVTWSINSVCHIWGSRPFKSNDESRNNVLFGIIGLGEGWHNNHHAFPTSARHGLRWWQIDLSYYVIVGMKYLGLAYDIKVPSPSRQAMKRVG
ncbi:MAG: acyl-CoA desaturase [Planctomycetota bacterium]